LAFSVNEQLGFVLPEQGPPAQPAKRPVLVEANSWITVPAGKLAEQVVPQLMPAGLLVTEPVPVPDCTLFTVSVKVPVGGGGGGGGGGAVA